MGVAVVDVLVGDEDNVGVGDFSWGNGDGDLPFEIRSIEDLNRV